MPLEINQTQGTIGDGGRRIWVYAREVKGFFIKYRRYTAWVLLFIYLSIPWYKWNGEPLFLLDLLHGRWVLFGVSFWPVDLILFLPLLISIVVTVFLVTSLWGRIWCGWACPQTVFLQFVFEPIERFFEGNAAKREKQDKGPFKATLLFKKIAKHLVYVLFSALIANTFLAYFWGIDNVLAAITRSPTEHWQAFWFIVGISLVFYFIFSWFKEQACIIICPYARFQSVLVDEKSLNVMYDYGRGEPRGVPKKNSSENLEVAKIGDCVNCGHCVKVCPTGIDIRQGIQLECIGCAKCIDACDSIMTAWKRPTGLIRYASQSELENKPHSLLRPRVFVYSGLITILIILFGILLSNRNLTTLALVRKGASPYIENGVDSVTNIYSLSIRNKSGKDRHYQVVADNLPGHFNLQSQLVEVKKGEILSVPLILTTSRNFTQGGSKLVDLKVVDTLENIKLPVNLLGPFQ